MAAGLTQHQLSRLADIPLQIVAFLERPRQVGPTQRGNRPSWFVVRRLSWALGRAPEDLFPVPLPEPLRAGRAPAQTQAPAA